MGKLKVKNAGNYIGASNRRLAGESAAVTVPTA